MAELKSIAVNILTEAGQIVGGPKHGDVGDSFEMLAERWTNYIRNSFAVRHHGEQMLDARDVLMMMADLKMVRFVYAPAPNRENFVDGCGYLALAGMLDAMEQPHVAPAFAETIHDDVESGVATIASRLRPRRPE